MKAAYANYRPQRSSGWSRHLALAWSSDVSRAQGPEAHQVMERVQAVERHWQQRGEMLARPEVEVLTYDHIAPKPGFSVKGRYKFIGRLKPRQFQLDE